MRRRIPNSGVVAIAIISCCQITPKLQLNHHVDAFSPTPRNSSLNKRKANTLQQFDIDKLNTRNRRITNISPQHNSITSLQAAPIPVIAGTTSIAKRIISHGITTFMSNWKAYSLIPLIAGFVGWFTNYLAVQMIFYPLKWRGIPIYRVEGEPLGLIGWQGIVPAKTLKMSEAMVTTTINELLTMEEIIQRLDPDTVATILQPEVSDIIQPFIDELLRDKPQFISKFAIDYTSNTDGYIQSTLSHEFLKELTVDVQSNIGSICNLRNCVVNKMMTDRSLLGKLFQISGKDELDFLVDSGLLFGFVLQRAPGAPQFMHHRPVQHSLPVTARPDAQPNV